MKQKGQAIQNMKKELKETLNWTSSEETVAPDAPVTLNQSNRLASDTPVLYDRCNGPSKCPSHGLVQSSTGYTGGTNLWHRCKHHVMHQRACQVGEKMFLQHRMNWWCTRVKHRCNFKTKAEDFFRTG